MLAGDIPAPIRFPVTGLCLGYPIEKTIELIQRMASLPK